MKAQTRLLMAMGFLMLAALSACNTDNFPKYDQLGGLRILALRADLGSSGAGQAEFSAGDSVVITPYISDFNGNNRTLTYAAVGCYDPGVGNGATPTCAGSSSYLALASGTVSLTGGVSSTGQANTFSLTIPSGILSGYSPVTQYNGVNYVVIYTLTAADGTTLTSFKRLVVSSSSKTKNQNPSLSGILSNGASLTTLPSGDVSLAANYTAASIESYSTMNSDGSLTAQAEQLVTTFFITDGTLNNYHTLNNQTTTYSPPGSEPSGHTAVVVAVTRDNRGGVAFYMQSL